jgi:protoporphyrinogen/coproporphyrinogen III oxidase
MMSLKDRWIIVGGGASGLAAAFFLKQLGMDCEIVERDKRIGGRMGTVELGDRSLDCGGKNIGKRYTLFRQFAASLGTHPLEYFGLNSSQVQNGKIKTFDSNARWRSMWELARGASASDMVRFAGLLLRVKRDEVNGYLGSAYSRELAQQYDRLPVSEYFSPEFRRRIIRPMTVRMNGAEPDEVYMGNLASNVRMLLDTYEQFRHGLAPLLNSFLDRYEVHLNTAVESLVVTRGRVTGVRVRDAHGNAGELNGAGVILATPAPIAAELAEPVVPAVSQDLRSVAYYPVTLIVAEYDRPVFSANVRALVFDESEVVSNAGAYGVNDLHLVRYTFSGKTSRKHIRTSTDNEALLRAGEAALSKHLPFDARSRRRFVAKRFGRGLCAYTPYHGRFIERVHEELKNVAGLHITGDYVQGASIEACFRSAFACVERLAQDHKLAIPAHLRTLGQQRTSTESRSDACASLN